MPEYVAIRLALSDLVGFLFRIVIHLCKNSGSSVACACECVTSKISICVFYM